MRAIRCVLAAALLLGARARAEEWPSWLQAGDAGDGTGLSTNWEGGRDVAWMTPLPGPGASTPAVCGRRVFLTAIDAASGNAVALVVDRRSGSIVRTIPVSRARPFPHDNTAASPSPAADGARAYFAFGTGELVATDADGNVAWRRDLAREHGQPFDDYGYSSSPLLHDGVLYVQVLQNDRPTSGLELDGRAHESYVMSLDARSGRTIARVVRATQARAESKEAYTTPVCGAASADAPGLFVFGGDALTCHRMPDCAELWRWEGYDPGRRSNDRVISSPLVAGAHVYVVSPRGRELYALDAGTGKVVWTWKGRLPDVCVPRAHGGRLIVLDGDHGAVTCLDRATGALVWEGRLEGRTTIYATPTVADGRIYLIDVDGMVTVLGAGERFEVLARFAMGEGQCYARIVAAGGRIYVRTAKNLYCIAAR